MSGPCATVENTQREWVHARFLILLRGERFAGNGLISGFGLFCFRWQTGAAR